MKNKPLTQLYGIITENQPTMILDQETWCKEILDKSSNINHSPSIPNILQIHKLTKRHGENGPVTLDFFDL